MSRRRFRAATRRWRRISAPGVPALQFAQGRDGKGPVVDDALVRRDALEAEARVVVAKPEPSLAKGLSRFGIDSPGLGKESGLDQILQDGGDFPALFDPQRLETDRLVKRQSCTYFAIAN